MVSQAVFPLTQLAQAWRSRSKHQRCKPRPCIVAFCEFNETYDGQIDSHDH